MIRIDMSNAHLRRGELTRYVAVQALTGSTDSFGQPVQTWTTLKNVYAKIEALSGREIVVAQAINTEVTHRITVQYDDDLWADPRVVASRRILYGSRVFDIRSMENIDEANRAVALQAFEGVTRG